MEDREWITTAVQETFFTYIGLQSAEDRLSGICQPGTCLLVVQYLRGAGKRKRKHSNDSKCQRASFPDDSSECHANWAARKNCKFLLKTITVLEDGKVTEVVCVEKGWRVLWGTEADVQPTPNLMEQQNTWEGIMAGFEQLAISG